jgi:pimeloyl-ACP methyl ester carboxylesterase
MNKVVAAIVLFCSFSVAIFGASPDLETAKDPLVLDQAPAAPPSAPARTVTVNGLKVRYFAYGTDNEAASERPAIVFLHGWAASGMEGTPIGERLGLRYRFYAPDFPGLGGSEPLPEYSMDTAVSWLGDFAEAIGLGKFILIGHSLGGHISTRFAIAHPEELSKLVLIAPEGFPREEGYLYSVFSKSDFVIDLGMIFMSPFTYSSGVILNLPDWSRYAKEVNEYGGRSVSTPRGKAALAKITRNILGTQTVEGDLGLVSMPVLLVWGRNDRVLPFGWSQEFLKGLPPGAEFLAIDRCGHTPMLEYPEAVASRIMEFVEE